MISPPPRPPLATISGSSQRVLITGATGGIGRDAALYLAERGWQVFATGRRPDRLAELASEAGARGLTIETLPLDVCDPESIARAQAVVGADGGALDALINNAGYAEMGPVETISDAVLRRQFETNVVGLLRVTRAFLPAMLERGRGRILNMSSVVGRVTIAMFGAYCATKYAVEALSDALRQELAPFGVHVAVIEPANVNSSFVETAFGSLRDRTDRPWQGAIERAHRLEVLMNLVGASPRVVSRTMHRALTEPRPRARYATPLLGKLEMAAVRLAPQAVVDGAIRTTLGLGHRWRRTAWPPSGATAVITGAAGGIGSATAEALRRRGLSVVATDVDAGRLERLAERLPGVETLRMDVTDPASIAEAVERVERLTGGRGADVLVNNAGYAELGPLAVIPDEVLRAQLDVNVFGLAAVTRAFLPAMRDRGAGRIINISSIAGVVSFPFMGAYTASKFAVEALSDALRQELAGRGVDVSIVEPSFIHTGFAQAARHTAARYDARGTRWEPVYARMDGVIERLARLGGQPADVAAAIAEAALSPRPRARYQAPRHARLAAAALPMAPAWLTDRVFGRLFAVDSLRAAR